MKLRARRYPASVLAAAILLNSLLLIPATGKRGSSVDLLSESLAPSPRVADVLTSEVRAAAGNELGKICGRHPVRFEVNEVQADSAVRFVARGCSYSIGLTSDGAVFRLAAGNGPTDAVSLANDGHAPWMGDIAGRSTRRGI